METTPAGNLEDGLDHTTTRSFNLCESRLQVCAVEHQQSAALRTSGSKV